jgi:hypothetical protein
MNFPVLYEGSGDPTFPVVSPPKATAGRAKRVPNGMGNVIAKRLISLPRRDAHRLPDSDGLLHCEIHLDVYAALHYIYYEPVGDRCRHQPRSTEPDAHAAGRKR